MPKTKVLFAASELTPIAKVGGLGDVAGALPQALRKANIDARVIIPRYEQIKKKDLELVKKNIPVNFSNVEEKISVYKTTIAGTPIYLIDNPKFLSRGPIYASTTAFVDSPGELKRFLFFSACISHAYNSFIWKPDIIHCQDWHTALVPQLLQAELGDDSPKTLLTIHNIANQGSFPAKTILNFLGLKLSDDELKAAPKLSHLKTLDQHSNLNLFQQGLLSADLLNTVSPTYAKELLTKQYGEGLESTIRKRKKDLHGILNGIDTARFNPGNDEALSDQYTHANVRVRKATNKNALKKSMKLELDIEGPLFGIVSRLTNQKGIELIADIIPTIIQYGGQLVFLGTGDPALEKLFAEAASEHPEFIAGRIDFDATLAQQIYGASDYFLMPSRFEPCGLGQMIAMRYGAVPIVRATGGLKDSVHNLSTFSSHKKATGLVFKPYKTSSLKKEIIRAHKLYYEKPELYRQIQKNGMTADFSWKPSAALYAKLYKKLVTRNK